MASCIAVALTLTLVNVPASGVVPPIAPGAGNDVTFAVPLKELPPIVLAFCKAVAVPAFPLIMNHAVVALFAPQARIWAMFAFGTP